MRNVEKNLRQLAVGRQHPYNLRLEELDVSVCFEQTRRKGCVAVAVDQLSLAVDRADVVSGLFVRLSAHVKRPCVSLLRIQWWTKGRRSWACVSVAARL